MRAYRIDSLGSVDGVALGSCDDPRPGTREILVRVRATSLNYRNLMVLKGGGRGRQSSGSYRSAMVPARLPRSVMASRDSPSETGSSAVFTRAGSAVQSRRII